MGLFDIFKKQEDNSPAKEDLAKAKEHFDKGEFQETLRTLMWGFKKDADFKPLYKLAADSLRKLNAADEQLLFEAINKNINDSNAFHNLGNFYFSVGHYDLAQTFYEKTLQLNPNNEEVPHDLAISYARRFQISKAVEVLTNSKSNDFWNLYFLNKCKILDKKVEGVQEAINDLQSFLEGQPNQDDLVIPKMKVNELQETLQRFNTISEIQTHIRDWQFIQYGGAVLDYFEDGEHGDYVAGGRYVASWGSNESIKTITNKLKQFADKLSISFQGVVSLSDRDSEIIGRLLAKEFGVSFNFYEPTNSNQDCLVVSSDSSHFIEHQELNKIQNGQVVFSVNHNWLDSSIVSPDIIGFMTQTYSFPWAGGGLRVIDMESRKIERIPQDNRSAEEIATDIFNIKQQQEDINKHLEFYAQRKSYLKGIGKLTNNNRYNFMVESPVPGSYFG
ncbi:MAG: tetratricopeptide repeat protein [Cytophagia bacterium]|nr:tetratricopeptide repeat protein [Cytophagia bacterium]